jgi:23S rRNA (cytosine1962-C5)-methyltransferase
MSLTRVTTPFKDYELLDSGDRRKCERFGDAVLVRPEPQALWSPSDPSLWASPNAVFTQKGGDSEHGQWKILREPREPWTVRWGSIVLGLKFHTFKHTGIFPEQASNWAHLTENLRKGQKVLNLFGYTGGATLAALSAGAEAVHVDASRSAIASGKRNAELSGLADASVRWIEDDAMKFVDREVRRGNAYDCIIMDPPAFGRGPKNEVWKFEDGLLPLVRSCAKLLKPGGLMYVNAYSLGFPAIAVEQVVREVFPKAASIETVELTLKETAARGFVIPAGITVRVRA